MVSISSTEVFLSVMVPVGGRLQGWFQLPGLPGYLLALFFAFAPPPPHLHPANLLDTSSQARQLAMSLKAVKSQFLSSVEL